MAEQKKFKMEQTKGSFKVNGVIVGLANDKAYSNGKGKNEMDWESIRFGVKTSTTNIVNVELFGQEREYVYPYSKAEGKSMKVAFNKRDNLDEGYHLIGVNISTLDAEGGTVRKNYVEFDAPKVIMNEFKDGDSVFITGEVVPNVFVSNSGDTISSPKFSIKSIKKLKDDIDLKAEKFIETASFEQEIVIDNTVEDKNAQKVIVNARTIGYADSYKEIQFVIHKDKNEKLANKFLKLKFGDFILVQGILTSVEVAQVEESDEWGSETPRGYGASKGSRHELRITAVGKDENGTSVYTSKKYKEEDFVKDEVDSETDTQEIEDDDLPF